MKNIYQIAILALFLIVMVILISACGNTTPIQTTSALTKVPAPSATQAITQPPTSSVQSSVTPTQVPSKPTTTTPPSISAQKYGGLLKWVSGTSPSGSIGYPPDIVGVSTSIPQMCIEGLLRENDKGAVIPWLAESYKVADDFKSITFYLKKGVKFHDGTDFNAQAAKWNLENTIAAKTRPDWRSVEILDDYTIRVNLNQFSNTTLRNFGDVIYSWMISPAAFQKNGKDWARMNPVGTGPFKFVSYSRDVSFKTVRNSDYWQKGKPYLDAVEILFVADWMTQRAVMQSLSAEMLAVILGKQSDDMAAAGMNVTAYVTTNTCLYPDTLNPDSPYYKQQVREAVEYAIDRESIAKGLGYGYWKAPYQVPGRDTLAYTPNFTLARKYDPAKAKQLLTEAGYPNGFKTTIISAPLGRDQNVLLAVQSYLKAVNIQADIELPDMAKYDTYLYGTMRNAMILGPIAGYANWNSTLEFYFSPTLFRLKSWARTPEFLKLYQASLSSSSPDAALMRAVSEQLTKEASIIPVVEAGNGWATQPYVMECGWGERGGGPIYWKPEQTWLNK